MRTRRLTLLALFTTLSLAVYAIESAIPPLLPIPGIKLGLSNIITLILLKNTSVKDATLVLLARILLSTLLFGQMLSLLYSLTGGFFSLTVMALSTRLLRQRMSYLSGALGGLAHNMGQILIAFFLTSTVGVFSYLPFLIVSGILTGLFTGLCAEFAGKYLNRAVHNKHT